MISSTGLPSLVRRRCSERVPSSSMVAVPMYGIDGLASDDRISWAEQAAAAHSMMKAIAMLFMISVSWIRKRRDVIRYRTVAIHLRLVRYLGRHPRARL